MDQHSLSVLTKTLPDLRLHSAYIRNSQQFITTSTIISNHGQNGDTVTRAILTFTMELYHVTNFDFVTDISFTLDCYHNQLNIGIEALRAKSEDLKRVVCQ